VVLAGVVAGGEPTGVRRVAARLAFAGMDRDAVRQVILALPEVEEYDHGDLPAFRIRGKRFATMLDEEGVNLMPGEPAIRALVEQYAEVCTERWWGTRLAAVRVSIAGIAPELLEELVLEAWSSKAPASVLRAHGL
jgi:hypothetical protein